MLPDDILLCGGRRRRDVGTDFQVMQVLGQIMPDRERMYSTCRRRRRHCRMLFENKQMA